MQSKQRFTRADGTRGAVKQTRELPQLKPGHWWMNRAPLGTGFNHWHEEPAPQRT